MVTCPHAMSPGATRSHSARAVGDTNSEGHSVVSGWCFGSFRLNGVRLGLPRRIFSAVGFGRRPRFIASQFNPVSTPIADSVLLQSKHYEVVVLWVIFEIAINETIRTSVLLKNPNNTIWFTQTKASTTQIVMQGEPMDQTYRRTICSPCMTICGGGGR